MIPLPNATSALNFGMEEDSEVKRQRLREKIRSKRNQRLGTTEEGDTSNDSGDPSMLQMNDPATRIELSRRVESELRKVFGSDPDAMNVAQQFIDDPMSVMKSHTDSLSNLSKEEKMAVESLMKVTEEDDDEEAPPMQ